MCLSASLMQAQITIGGNVYGGGNAGKTGGNTTVTVHAGDLNRVFGGARMADVKGTTSIESLVVRVWLMSKAEPS